MILLSHKIKARNACAVSLTVFDQSLQLAFLFPYAEKCCYLSKMYTIYQALAGSRVVHSQL